MDAFGDDPAAMGEMAEAAPGGVVAAGGRATAPESFESFVARFGGLFARSEPRQQAAKYLRALLADTARKNGWRLAEVIGDETPDRMQRLLYRATWDAEAARDLLMTYVVERFGDPAAVGVVDDIGFVKKGSGSVGVERQSSGAAGRVENSQVATFLVYAAPRGRAPIDRRLYLPERWLGDARRRARAKIPPAIGAETKPAQAAAMLAHAWGRGVPMAWVAGDEVYGDAMEVRRAARDHGRWYVLGVSPTTMVGIAPAAPPDEARPAVDGERAGPPPPAQTSARSAAAEVGAWPAAWWRRLPETGGDAWARVWVAESWSGRPGPAAWLLARRPAAEPAGTNYYLAHAPRGTPLAALARIALIGDEAEAVLAAVRREVGLDQYEVRHWASWHRHVTLAMMADAWLVSQPSAVSRQPSAVSRPDAQF